MSKRTKYVELHLHTGYSFLDGASLPDEMLGRAIKLGYEALAITDHDGLHGAMEFAKLADSNGVRPITGAELTLIDGSHLTLLAETEKGYANLCQLITEAHRDRGELDAASGAPSAPSSPTVPFALRGIGKSKYRYRKGDREPRLDPALLREHADGLILLTGCRQGKLAQLVDASRTDEAESLLRDYIAWFGADDVFVELQQNFVHGDTARIRRLVQIADKVGVPYVATGNAHYHVRERHRLQDVLVAIRHRTTLDDCHRERRPNAQFYLRSPQEAANVFKDYPAAIEVTAKIAERCATFNLARHLSYTFPDYDTGSAETADDMLGRICREMLISRYTKKREEAEKQLDNELAVIRHHGLSGFFLLYRDLLLLARDVADEVRGTDTARSRGNLPPGRGRGSSVSSIVCYLIGLSHIDPLDHNLFVGRFLNEDVGSFPDIDLDFPREIRERLIERVYEKYGSDHAALVCAFPTYKLRSAVRDIGKALGLPAYDLDRIAKLAGSHSARSLGKELALLPAYAAHKDVPPWSHLIELADQLADFPRHVSQHVGGMIVSTSPLTKTVPIQPAAMEGRYLCQWDKDSCDDARFVKIDFLALGMLSLVEECLELIAASKEESEEPVDLSRIGFEDPAIYDMICAGDTIGTFQIESRAQIQMLPKTYPRELKDLIVQVAIVRPGPIVGGAVTPYVKHRQKERTFQFLEHIEPEYDDESLKAILEETKGVILYQEQVIQVAMTLAGFTSGQADGLRRAMTRKRSHDSMAQYEELFMAGADKKGVKAEVAKKVFKKLLGFAEYGFPKAHAAAFAVLAYQSAWLKYYYPTEFICALLNNQPMGFYAPHVLINDAKRHGVRVLTASIHWSGVRCTVEDGNTIRVGFGYVKGLGEEPARRIVLEREANGPYCSLPDLIRRVSVSTEAVEHLAMVGAFEDFGLGRREALWQVGLFVPSRRFGRKQQTDAGRQMPLALSVDQDNVELRPMDAWDQTAADYDILDLSPRYHPLGVLRRHLPSDLVSSAELNNLPNEETIRIGGLVVCRQRPGTAKDITFILLEDEFGLVNVVVYPTFYEKQRLLVRAEPFIIVEGRLQKEGGTINVIATELSLLEAAHKTFAPPSPSELELTADLPILPSVREVQVLAPPSHNFR